MIKTILLADDSLTIQKVVELTFADTQYNVVSLSSGDELLEKLGDVKPELVICDIIMPGRDGYDVCQEIKSNPDTLHIPVILLSGTFEPFDRDRALAAGCSEIVAKPFEAKHLVDAVDTLLSSATEDVAIEAAPDDVLVAESTFGGADGATPTGDPEFGTQLASNEADDDPMAPEITTHNEGDGAPDDGIDFTTSGFADMEAAADAVGSDEDQASVEGLDFESNQDFKAEPFPGDSDEEFADAFSDVPPPFGEFEEPGTDEASVSPSDPFAADDRTDHTLGVDEPSDRDTEVDPSAETFESTPPAAALGTDAGSELADDFTLQSPEEAFRDPPAAIVTDADTAPVPQIDDETGSSSDVDTDEHETHDAAPASPLSDEDVDRIARRVLELAADRIEQVAWEVIPDVAEVAVRERIRELEAEFETEN